MNIQFMLHSKLKELTGRYAQLAFHSINELATCFTGGAVTND
jgi:hypothetical protein